jgi:hypothetical protein
MTPRISKTIIIVPNTFASGRISAVTILSSPFIGSLSVNADVLILISYLPTEISPGGVTVYLICFSSDIPSDVTIAGSIFFC